MNDFGSAQERRASAGAPKPWVIRRWRCFRDGHHWALGAWFGPDYCKNCGKVVDW